MSALFCKVILNYISLSPPGYKSLASWLGAERISLSCYSLRKLLMRLPLAVSSARLPHFGVGSVKDSSKKYSFRTVSLRNWTLRQRVLLIFVLSTKHFSSTLKALTHCSIKWIEGRGKKGGGDVWMELFECCLASNDPRWSGSFKVEDWSYWKRKASKGFCCGSYGELSSGVPVACDLCGVFFFAKFLDEHTTDGNSGF